MYISHWYETAKKKIQTSTKISTKTQTKRLKCKYNSQSETKIEQNLDYCQNKHWFTLDIFRISIWTSNISGAEIRHFQTYPFFFIFLHQSDSIFVLIWSEKFKNSTFKKPVLGLVRSLFLSASSSCLVLAYRQGRPGASGLLQQREKNKPCRRMEHYSRRV